MVDFIKYSKFYYAFSGVLVAASIAALAFYGLQFGIDFTGGSAMELQFPQGQRPDNAQVREALAEFELGEVVVQPVGENLISLKFKEIQEATHQRILEKFVTDFSAVENSFEYIGPAIGNELRTKTLVAMGLTLLAITAYIAVAFRKVSRPVSSFKYGLASLVALFHDILIPVGAFAILGKFYGAEITIPIVAALLTILGFSVHDTIVIFDRIRENITRKGAGQFEEAVNESLNQTLGRSLTTSITTLLVLFSLFFFGGETLRYFSLALIIGIIAGAYSSIFIASPLLVSWHRQQQKSAK